jgi:hypothetical protein
MLSPETVDLLRQWLTARRGFDQRRRFKNAGCFLAAGRAHRWPPASWADCSTRRSIEAVTLHKTCLTYCNIFLD